MTIINIIGPFCLTAVIVLVIYHQIIWGMKQGSKITALIFPVGYATFSPLLTFALVGVTDQSLLFAGSQLIVAYWLYWIYQWGQQHPQKPHHPQEPLDDRHHLTLAQRNDKLK